jgi:hypothetical protein
VADSNSSFATGLGTFRTTSVPSSSIRVAGSTLTAAISRPWRRAFRLRARLSSLPGAAFVQGVDLEKLHAEVAQS